MASRLNADAPGVVGVVVIGRNEGERSRTCISTLKGVAARARNEGFRRLRGLAPELAYVQIVDRDCEVVAVWIGNAAAWLGEHRDVAVLCGLRRERYPGRSIYNAGLDTLEFEDFEHLCKPDPGLECPPVCFARVIEQIEGDGRWISERPGGERTAGQIRRYRAGGMAV